MNFLFTVLLGHIYIYIYKFIFTKCLYLLIIIYWIRYSEFYNSDFGFIIGELKKCKYIYIYRLNLIGRKNLEI